MNELGELLRSLDYWWIYPAGALFVTVSAMIPPVPSTTLFVALGSLSAQTDHLNPYLLAAAMLAGAVAGDAATFFVARRFNLTERKFFSGRRWQSGFQAARTRLGRKGLPLVLTSRFVPLGRLTLNVAAAMVPQPLRRFMAHSVLAGVLWSAYSVGVGTVSGALPQLSTEFAVLLAIAVSLALGTAINHAVSWWEGRQLPEFVRTRGSTIKR
ncbi:DedA family protein [Arthrobacter castelli]|uniref:DedA family protein n=1 Tax=Arthrobacter castelli TaxID=271431 RepID=UPI000416A14D|nr:VTT domain-containing protein [Arthrobacter castelli]